MSHKQLEDPTAKQALDKFKLEAAQDFNISDEYKSSYWENIDSRPCGSAGGQMVRRMVQQHEDVEKYKSQIDND
ncbi:alpha/beta-type small acid-soluble spore protein [Natroniella sulfidigena]|uniref:alpha/beta-type small acid-soluble spore protein n=1 Tax=Natroniella sulfidigena TaxID=723921 RepID=UPI00200B9DA3|nr:alpha/beta-type small acid-soluble spore protein [Natroniella sulfidigena]MCK8817305.1 alpha/beta-type small acid-soluble spore protein [Natroniella sulfidigena]